LSSYLEEKGIRNHILDFFIENNINTALENAIKAYKPNVIGITAFTANIKKGAILIKKARDFGFEGFTIIGGAHASALPMETLDEFPEFDFLIYGEGEKTLYQLICHLDSSFPVSEVNGVAYHDGDDIKINPPMAQIDNLDSLPFPNRDKVRLDQYRPNPANYLRLPNTGILFSRGCPFQCAFCSKKMWGSQVRYRSATNVLEEIGYCMERYGIYDFRFYDEGITTNREALEIFCRGIFERNWNLTWNCFSRTDLVDLDLLKLMKDAGCYHIKYGVEAGTERVLDLMNKKITLEDSIQAVKNTKKIGIECQINIIFGTPGETVKEMEQTIHFVKKLSPDLVSFHIFRPLPGSFFSTNYKKRDV